MSSSTDQSTISAQAIALRLAGHSRREIIEILGPMSGGKLSEALRGTPPPEWTRRPRARDEDHAEARRLREEEGLSYAQIAARLGVSKSSISLWIRDMPRPAHLSPEESHKRAVAGLRQHWERKHAYRDEFRAAASREIGQLTDRETIIAGAIAYWCEGSKTKPWRTAGARVTFINSDPSLIRFFLRFLDIAGIERTDLVFRVQIHESADVAAAERFWQELTGAPVDQFRRPTLKRHNPKTVRKNTGEDYRGCLVVNVRRSGEFYRKIEGWMSAITLG
jgi:transcriptional regulator with XRE-family HTH domain